MHSINGDDHLDNAKNILLKSAVEKFSDKAKALSDDLFAHPETGEKELRSSQKIVELLREHGFEVEYPFYEEVLGYPTAFRAVIDCGEGPSAAILVEYDALPGIGHACGHNLHGSMSVLAGLALAEIKDSFKGKLYVIGTPAEELVGAKVHMAAGGIFDDMALVMMIHTSSGIGSQPQMDLFNYRSYNIEYFGKQAHSAAAPWMGRNALSAARKFMDLVDARRECFHPDMRCSSVILSGGTVPNIVAPYAKLSTEFRSCSMGSLKEIDSAVRKCAEAAAMALDCEVKIDDSALDFFDMVRVKRLEDAVCELFVELGEPVLEVAPPIASSDMGNVSYRCPAIQPLLSIVDEPYPLHTTELADATTTPKAQKAMEKGAYIIASMMLKAFNDEQFRSEIYVQFQKAVAAKNG